MIRTLIVDDEPLARQALRVRLEGEEGVEILGEAADGEAAVEAIRTFQPDLVFLDVQMPGLDGFEVLEKVAGHHLPMVVFVTAHDAHVLKAFDIHALDYLLKPYSESRFKESLRRARVEVERGGAVRTRIGGLLDDLRRDPREGGYPRRFAVRDADRIVLVRTVDLDAIEAAGNYVTLVTRDRKYLLRQTLSEVATRLDPARFARIHRSTIVNLDRVRELRPDPHGDCDVVLESGAAYRLSRLHRDRLMSSFGGSTK